MWDIGCNCVAELVLAWNWDVAVQDNDWAWVEVFYFEVYCCCVP